MASGKCRAGIAMRLLVLMTGTVVGWIWWTSGQPVNPAGGVAGQAVRDSNGVWTVPVADPSGKRTEPMVLVPVAARPAPAPTLTPRPTSQPSLRATNEFTAKLASPSPAAASISNAPAKGSGRTNPSVSASAASSASPSPQSTNAAARLPFDERLLAAQVALGWHGISSGPFDGVKGAQTRAAVQVFQKIAVLPVTGALDDLTLAALGEPGPLYTNYVVSEDDLASLQPLGKTWVAKSQQTSLAYETILELVAERTHSNVKLVRWLNPQIDWARVPAGAELKVVSSGFPPADRKAAFIRIHLAERKLQAFDADTNLLIHFPCSIAARVDKRPLGEELHIAAIAPNPNYTFDPAVFPESAEAQQLGRKLILQPGPNNPVGTVWLSLDKPGYGIHGTPKPEEVGRTESHGCFRLANWNAEHLLKLVTVGTPVFVEP